MFSVVQQLKDHIHQALDRLQLPLDKGQIIIEVPNNPEYGDYATNVAMRLAKAARKAPPMIAKDLVAELQKDPKATAHFSFSIAGGFINVRISDTYLIDLVQHKITADLGRNTAEKPQKILLEYVSANPTGPLHIGHGRWAALGDVLARLLAHVGHKVTKEFYINDQGKQINNLYASVDAIKNGKPVPEDGYHGQYVHELAKMDVDPVQHLLAEQKQTLASMSVSFDNWFSEKKLHEAGSVKKAIELLNKNGALEEKEGALWFKSTNYGDDKDRVIIRANGETTYFAADIAYHENKIDRGFEQLINIWGADHHGYIARVKAALKALTNDPNFDRLHVILGQLVSLYRNGEPVRMSKRTGEMITLQEVIEETGPDATRYFLVSRSADTALDFDLEIAKKKNDENPVYYVQYAHARISSILRQEGAQVSGDVKKTTLEALERQLILMLVRIPDEIALMSETYSIHRLTSLAQELAAIFHRFYHEYRVLSDNKEDTLWRLTLIKAIREALRVLFGLLGVSAPEQM